MRRFAIRMIVPLLVVTLAGVAAQTGFAQVFGSNGNSGVYVQGNGQAMAGTFDENGFRGIAAGPDGRVRRIDGRDPMSNPFLAKPKSRPLSRKPADKGAFAGATAGRTAVGPRGFDPFEFVFGNSGPTAGIGVFAGDLPSPDLTAARRTFQQGRYDETLRLTDRMLRIDPHDIQAEQVKALALFALGKYDEAAAAAYPVLEANAAWSWKDLRAMYPDTESYLKHLRRLQDSAGPGTSAGTMFLLAYHYLMLHKMDEAREALEKTKILQPDNLLVDDLLASLPPTVENR